MNTSVIIIIVIVVIAIIGIFVWVFWPESGCEEETKDNRIWPFTEFGKIATICDSNSKVLYSRVCNSNTEQWGDVTSEQKTSSTCESFTNYDEILVPIYVDKNHPQYGNPTSYTTFTDQGTVMNLVDTYPYRARANLEGYPANPDLYPENGVEFRPENNMYIHLENNFLDIGPQIGVGTRVNSQRNSPQLLFRRQYAVPTMPTGYWNQSTISQPIFMNNSC